MELRRLLARLGVLVLICTGLVFATTATAHACSCAPVSLRASVAGADAVFVGTPGELVAGLRVTRYVEVSSVYKGDVAATVTVNTGQEGPEGIMNSCDYDLVPGQKRVFFAAGSGAEWSSGMCSDRFEPLGATLRGLDARLGRPSPPRSLTQAGLDAAEQEPLGSSGSPATPWEVWVGLSAGALAGAIALVLWRSRRGT